MQDRATTGAVFLSYASEDAVAAQRICDALRAAGIAVWFDQHELRSGDAWDQKIRRQVRECSLFVPMISMHTVRHEGYFRLEWDLADQRSHMMARDRAFIVPVCLDQTLTAGSDVPDSFHLVQWTRLPGGNVPADFCSRIASLLRSQQVSAIAGPSTAPGVVPSTATTRPRPRSRLGIMTAVLVVVSLGGWGAFRVWSHRSSGALAAGQSPAIGAVTVPATAPDKSIVVLPFLDMSERHDQEYFSDGLTEELIDRLAHAPDLKVIARTSSFFFKGKQTTIAEIGRTLAVTHVLEGSVRKAGNALRITAQLIRAADGVHLWSQTFDRDLVDVFKLQTELANTVAGEMSVALDGHGNSGAGHESTPEAYNLKLEADYYSRRTSKANVQNAIALYQRALKLDPHYAAAWSSLAQAYMDLNFFGMQGSESVAGILQQAQAALAHAIADAPESSATYAVKGRLALFSDFDWSAAEANLRKAAALDPSFDMDRAEGFLSLNYGRVDESVAAYQRSLGRDPVSTDILGGLGWAYFAAGRFPEAVATYRRLSQLIPGFASAKALEGAALLLSGHKEQALAAVEQETEDAWKVSVAPAVYWALGRKADSDAALNRLERMYAASSAYNVAEMRAYRGEKALACQWLERAYRQRDGGISSLKPDPFLRSLHDEACFRDVLVKLKLDVAPSQSFRR